jgi:hypothetical protein
LIGGNLDISHQINPPIIDIPNRVYRAVSHHASFLVGPLLGLSSSGSFVLGTKPIGILITPVLTFPSYRDPGRCRHQCQVLMAAREHDDNTGIPEGRQF